MDKKYPNKARKPAGSTSSNTIDQYFKKNQFLITPKKTPFSENLDSKDKKPKSNGDSENTYNIVDINCEYGNSNCQLCVLESFIDDSWKPNLKNEYFKSYFTEIKRHLHTSKEFFPPINQIFNFTKFTNFNDIKIVILGQDPYHNPGQAMGLSFSVPKGVTIPPSLRNIYTELKSDIGNFEIPKHGDLTAWAKQGVLLLNDTLTVVKNSPTSHAKIGWKVLTSKILELINSELSNIVFILWGGHARSKANIIDKSKHLVLEAAHPSPMSVELFKGCKHFSKANEYLIKHKKAPIDWSSL